MTDQNIVTSPILIVVGTFMIFSASKFLKDSDYADNYIKFHPKAWLLRNIFGEDKALKITKAFFAPLGILIGVSLILFGILFFIKTI